MDHGLLCPHCQARYRKAYNLGDELTCKGCGKVFIAGDVASEALPVVGGAQEAINQTTEGLAHDVDAEASKRRARGRFGRGKPR